MLFLYMPHQPLASDADWYKVTLTYQFKQIASLQPDQTLEYWMRHINTISRLHLMTTYRIRLLLKKHPFLNRFVASPGRYRYFLALLVYLCTDYKERTGKNVQEIYNRILQDLSHMDETTEHLLKHNLNISTDKCLRQPAYSLYLPQYLSNLSKWHFAFLVFNEYVYWLDLKNYKGNSNPKLTFNQFWNTWLYSGAYTLSDAFNAEKENTVEQTAIFHTLGMNLKEIFTSFNNKSRSFVVLLPHYYRYLMEYLWIYRNSNPDPFHLRANNYYNFYNMTWAKSVNVLHSKADWEQRCSHMAEVAEHIKEQLMT